MRCLVVLQTEKVRREKLTGFCARKTHIIRLPTPDSRVDARREEHRYARMWQAAVDYGAVGCKGGESTKYPHSGSSIHWAIGRPENVESWEDTFAPVHF